LPHDAPPALDELLGGHGRVEDGGAFADRPHAVEVGEEGAGDEAGGDVDHLSHHGHVVIVDDRKLEEGSGGSRGVKGGSGVV